MSQGEALAIAKAPTGIAGLDEITFGGLPQARSTLIEGGPGSGKTVLALQVLAHGARRCGAPTAQPAAEDETVRAAAAMRRRRGADDTPAPPGPA